MFGTFSLAIATRVAPDARGSAASGKFTECRIVAVLEKLAQRVGDHHGAVLFRLVRRGAEVRQRDDLRMVLDARASGKSQT